MAKKTYKMTRVELFDTLVPIFAACWVFVFAYIALFNESSLFAMITVMPMFFVYGIYLIGSAIYCYKEVEILKAMELDFSEAEKRRRNKAPKLNKAKLIVSAGCIIAGILLCIFL